MALFGNNTYPIGVDMGDDALTMVQMANGKGKNAIRLHAFHSIEYPESIKAGSPSWQRWAIGVIARTITYGRFRGKKVIATMPAREVFIDAIKMPKVSEVELQNVILKQLKPKLKIAPEDALMQHFKTDSENILVMATDKTKLYKHLAIYENARLKVASVSIWPMAVLKAYSRLWARCTGQNDNPVMLLDVAKSYTNIIICDSANLYFAHSAPMGAGNLDTDRMADLLNSEIDMCRARFKSTYKQLQINQIIFISGHAVDKDIYTKIAERAKMPAQIGDCFDAIGATRPDNVRPDKVGPGNNVRHANWMTAMGLSLS
jgi:Tfp pilus assembly PilM family ATPase